MVVYACPHTYRMVCENGGNCYTGTGHDDGYFINFSEFTVVDDGMKESGAFQCIRLILEWTTSLDTSSRTLFVREGGREGGRMSVRMSTSRQTSSYVITSDCY